MTGTVLDLNALDKREFIESVQRRLSSTEKGNRTSELGDHQSKLPKISPKLGGWSPVHSPYTETLSRITDSKTKRWPKERKRNCRRKDT